MYIEFIKDYLSLKIGQVILISDRQGNKLIADEIAKKSTEKKLIAFNKKQIEKKALLRKEAAEKLLEESKEKASECKDCQGKTEPCKDCEEKEAETDK